MVSIETRRRPALLLAMGLAIDILLTLWMVLAAPPAQPVPDADADAVASPSVEFVFVGDLSFAARRTPRPSDRAVGEANPMRAWKERFDRADVVVANMEGLLNEPPAVPYGRGRTNIRAAPVWAATFAAVGVDVVGTANNHAWDGGVPGLMENRRHLQGTGVTVIGTGPDPERAEAAYVHQGPAGCIAVLPATLLSNNPRKSGAAVALYRGDEGFERLLAHVRRQRAQGCFVSVYIHWGRQMEHHPRRWLRRRAHRLIDAGAGLIVGHHPHVLQGVEFYGPGVVAYSLGNFVFTNRAAKKRQTGVLSVRFEPGALDDVPRLTEVALEPATIATPGFFVRPGTERELAATHRALAEYSRRWSTVTRDGDRLLFSPRSRRSPARPPAPEKPRTVSLRSD